MSLSTNHIEIQKPLIITASIIIITRNKINMKIMNINIMIKQINHSKKNITIF
jgi:hypothetical protein